MVSSTQQSTSNEKKKVASLFFICKWVAISLFGVFLFTVIGRAFPFALLLPAWQSGLVVAILSYAYMPLLAVCLVILADRLEDRSSILASVSLSQANFIKQLRMLSIAAALGFIFIIPLQGYNTVKINRQTHAQGLQTLKATQRSLSALKQAQTESQLRLALQGFPGLPQQAPLTVPLEQAKSNLLDALTPQVKQLENSLKEQNLDRWQTSIFQIIFNSAISLSYAIGFLATARFPRSHASVLESIIKQPTTKSIAAEYSSKKTRTRARSNTKK